MFSDAIDALVCVFAGNGKVVEESYSSGHLLTAGSGV